MADWYWLFWVLGAVGVIAALYGLDRLCLRLEDRGWLYYRKKKASSSPASAWVALQQCIEPGAKHVVHIEEEQQRQGEGEASRERLIASLLACLDSVPVNPEEVRFLLTVAKKAGVDWERLYRKAVQVQLSVRPDRAGLLPSADEVAPAEESGGRVDGSQ